MTVLKALGWLVLALVALVASYVFVFSGSFHTPVNVLTPAPYASPGGPILVFGGNRATGLEIVRMLREKGEDVTVAVRATSNVDALKAIGARTVVADALEADTVRAAFAGGAYKVVVSTLGTSRGENARRPDFVGNRNVIDAAKEAGATRFVFVTVIGTGNSREAAPRPARSFLKEVIELKGQAEDHLRASGLQYTIIRPGGLSEGKSTGQAVLVDDPEAFSYISRIDVAKLAVDAIGDPATIGKTYTAYDPARKTLWKFFQE
ncbi:MAG: SDR family oxidoreductase [Steroidobacteraceae bacterium]|nr:SDR family oxidoreductase [Steroidobacteraceae bacterium]